ncbi:unnamed protein product, partial [Nippostrongylus brasiliensis]|uniref:Chloride channel protein n=1 Tax=Nippostrongylus brasiliensis TaxID=27835 RepID=A0A0N4XFX3_NIPBR
VLFSIEVTSAYFAVRNYWRGFFAAICAATTFRIIRLVFKASEITVSAYYQTRFPEDAFFPEELPVFGLIGCVFYDSVFVLSIVCSTLPIPAGIFMPVFVIGASFGRLVGESMALTFPDGIRSNHTIGIYPGVYAVVGAASFCGSVTHTISVAVIVFELTGQLMHILPVMIAVLVGNVVCSYFQPSIYDSIIMIKALPYIPDVSHCSHSFHTVVAEQIMISDVKFIWRNITYHEMKEIVEENREIEAFPVVLDKESRILLGSVARKSLSYLIENKVGNRVRQLVIKVESFGRTILEFPEAARRARETFLSQDSRNESASSVEFHSEREMRRLLLSKRCSSIRMPLDMKQRTRKKDRRNSESLRLWHGVGSSGVGVLRSPSTDPFGSPAVEACPESVAPFMKSNKDSLTCRRFASFNESFYVVESEKR